MLTGVAGSRYFWGLGGQAPFFSGREGYLKTIKMYRFIFFSLLFTQLSDEHTRPRICDDIVLGKGLTPRACMGDIGSEL